MPIIRPLEAQIGDVTQHDIAFDEKVLVRKGSIITGAAIELIQKSNIEKIEITGNAFDDPAREDKKQHARKLHEFMLRIVENEKEFQCFKEKKTLSRREENAFKLVHRDRENIFDSLKTEINEIVNEMLNQSRLVVAMAELRSMEDYTASHSVNVCLLSLELGAALQYPRNRLQKLALGALLHDIGKHKVPPEIHYKPGKFTPEEYEEMKKHAKYGYDMLKDNPCVELTTAHIAYQHQEKFDGSGYPRGLKGDQIHEYAQIVAVADVYDAVLSRRPYKKSMLPHEATELLLGSGGSHFNVELVKAFTRSIPIYQEGNIIELDTGELVKVVEIRKGLSQRPIVKVVYSQDGIPIENGEQIDLSQEITRRITSLVKD